MLKKKLAKLAAFCVAVLLIILGLTIDFDTIKHWVSGNEIIVSSARRATAKEFLAGEKLRLCLKDVQSERVFWVFEESDVVCGDIEIEHAFPFAEGTPLAQARDRRVDAFFKSGDKYKVATKLVRTRNVKYNTKITFKESQLSVTAEKVLASEWGLSAVSIAKYSNGKFASGDMIPVSLTKDGKIGMAVLGSDAVAKALGLTDTKDLKAKIALGKNAWVSYELLDTKGNNKITIVEPLDKRLTE